MDKRFVLSAYFLPLISFVISIVLPLSVGAATIIGQSDYSSYWNGDELAFGGSPDASVNQVFQIVNNDNPVGLTATIYSLTFYTDNPSALVTWASLANTTISECTGSVNSNPALGCSGYLASTGMSSVSTQGNFITFTLTSPLVISDPSHYLYISLGYNYASARAGQYVRIGGSTSGSCLDYMYTAGTGGRGGACPDGINSLYFSLNDSGGFIPPPSPPPAFPFYAPIENQISSSTLYASTSTSASRIKTLPINWVVYVASTTDAVGSPIISDGYQWYNVTDPTDGVSGWMAGSDASNTIQYLPYNSSEQADLEATSSDYVATSSRPDLILAAVDHYYNDASTTHSLYSSSDGSNDIDSLKTGGYPEEVIPGIAAQESGGVDFNNEYVHYDYGHGIMQITPFEVWSHEATNDWTDNAGDNRGEASGISIIPCTSNHSDLYENCYVNGGEHSMSPESYQHYAASSTQPEYEYYNNTAQSIYANIKDGLQILSDKYALYSGISTGTTTGGVTYSANDISTILTTAAYNAIDNCSYVEAVADQLDDITSTFPNATTTDISGLIPKMHAAGSGTVCATLHSPANISIQDSSGRVVGIVNGEGKDSFPLAIYDKTQKSAEILATEDNNYTFRVEGTGTGTYEMDVAMNRNGTPVTFKATGIPITPGEVHTYAVDVQALQQGRNNAVTVEVDSRGDGTVDKTITTGTTFTAAQFSAAQSSTVGGGN